MGANFIGFGIRHTAARRRPSSLPKWPPYTMTMTSEVSDLASATATEPRTGPERTCEYPVALCTSALTLG